MFSCFDIPFALVGFCGAYINIFNLWMKSDVATVYKFNTCFHLKCLFENVSFIKKMANVQPEYILTSIRAMIEFSQDFSYACEYQFFK